MQRLYTCRMQSATLDPMSLPDPIGPLDRLRRARERIGAATADIDEGMTRMREIPDTQTIQPAFGLLDHAADEAEALRVRALDARGGVARLIKERTGLSLAGLADLFGLSSRSAIQKALARQEYVVPDLTRSADDDVDLLPPIPHRGRPVTNMVEVWPFAVERDPVSQEATIWLLTDDAWRDGPVTDETDPHTCVLRTLRGGPWPVLHSTSWRPQGTTIVLTYIAVLRPDPRRPIRADWPGAYPIGPDLLANIDKPIQVRADDAPIPSYIHVVEHALGHLADRIDRDESIIRALGDMYPIWVDALAPIEPQLAGMYLGPTP